MNEFISAQIILSLAGCVGIVIATTQLVKKFIKTDPKIIALIVSIILGIARIVVMQKYDIASIFVGILNIIPILWGAMGGYDSMIKPRCNKNSTNNLDNSNSNKSVDNINTIDTTENSDNNK